MNTFPQKAVTGPADDPFLVWNVTGSSEAITLHCWHNDTRITRELRSADAD